MSITTQRLILAGLIVACIFGLLAASLFLPLSGVSVQIEDVLLGALIGGFTAVVGYFFKR